MVRSGKIPEDIASQLRGLGPGMMMAALVGGKLAGFGLYMVVNQLFFAIARSLGLRIGVAVAGPIIGRTLAFLLGPAGWALAGIWLIFDLGQTNWKKTIGAVVMIAILRKKYDFEARVAAAMEIGG